MATERQTALVLTGVFGGEPFLKWAGGKTQLLRQLDPFFPKQFRTYYEPFLGSGAVFFHLRRTRGYFHAWLADSNEELIKCFQVVRDHVESLLPLLSRHKRNHGDAYYYAMRDREPSELSKIQRAARFIYLNKTCYNGLYRVNEKGQFNVPMGSYKNPRILYELGLSAASEALQGATLQCDDFSAVLDDAQKGDFLYIDPPYYTEKNGFTGYAVSRSGKAAFGADEHRRLSEVIKELHERGCVVVVSNSDTQYVRHLYRDFSIHVVEARRVINSNGSGRGPVTELVITNQ